MMAMRRSQAPAMAIANGCWPPPKRCGRLFREKFLGLWRANATGDAYPAALFADQADQTALEAERQRYMDRLWTDTVGFAAAKMIRRILGLAHNIDLEWINDPDRRAACEARILTLARDMVVNTANYGGIKALTAAATAMRKQSPRA